MVVLLYGFPSSFLHFLLFRLVLNSGGGVCSALFAFPAGPYRQREFVRQFSLFSRSAPVGRPVHLALASPPCVEHTCPAVHLRGGAGTELLLSAPSSSLALAKFTLRPPVAGDQRADADFAIRCGSIKSPQ